MAEVIVAQRMWQRRDTAANWTAFNPILASGEIGVEQTTAGVAVKFKIGDGVTPWASLAYQGSGGLPDIPTATVLGRYDAGTGPAQSLTLGSGLSIVGTALVAAGAAPDPIDGVADPASTSNSDLYATIVELLDAMRRKGWMAPVLNFSVFNSSGAFTVPSGVTAVDILVVGGGGGGGSRQGGGGGAGGLRFVSALPVTPSAAIPVTVGDGGAGGTSGLAGVKGGNSVFAATPVITAEGGGGGGGRSAGGIGTAGGSGGGATDAGSPGVGTTGQGFRGGLAPANKGGGGGGASEVGADGGLGDYTADAGPGGTGRRFPALDAYGQGGWFAGGGGGGGYNTLSVDGGGAGGLGGGGKGDGAGKDSTGVSPGPGLPGMANTGGGGGGSGSAGFAGGDGGSGVVIVIWPAGFIPA